MALSTFASDMLITGHLSAGSMTLPANSVTDNNVAANAAIQSNKLVHLLSFNYQQKNGTAIAADHGMLYMFPFTGTLISFRALFETVGTGDRTVGIDLLKGNAGSAFATVLSAPISLTVGTSVRTTIAAVLSTTSCLVDDILKFNVTLGGTTGNYPQGLLVTCVVKQNGV